MKLVVDSNVFVSSFFWKGNPRKVIDRITDGFDESYITDEILTEIADVMTRPKFGADVKAIAEYIHAIEEFSIKTNIAAESSGVLNPRPRISRDADDDKILECAVRGDVDFIITGDSDLLVLKEYANIKMVTPKEYVDMV
jgi:putative PIN family toxin of toxin-antitoxin system